MMGSETLARQNAKIEWRVEGTAPIERVDLIRDQFGLMGWNCSAVSKTASLIDRPPDGNHYYYLRIEQQDGELLWSSPVWVQSRCGGSNRGLPPWNAPEQVDLERVGDSPTCEHLGDLLAYLADPFLAVFAVYQHGGQIVDDLRRLMRTTFDDPLTIEAVQWYADLVRVYDVPPGPSTLVSPQEGWLHERVAMMAMSIDQRDESKRVGWAGKWPPQWGMVPLPSDVRSATMALVEGYAIAEAMQWTQEQSPLQ